jgi:hypothetical protein
VCIYIYIIVEHLINRTKSHLMAPPRGWANLAPEILLCITDQLRMLRCYLIVCYACTAWRSALAPAKLFLLFVVPDDRLAVAVSLPLDRKFHLPTVGRNSWCVGSSGGWLALATQPGVCQSGFTTLSSVLLQEQPAVILLLKRALIS